MKRTKNSNFKKLLSVLLAVVMIFSMIPMFVMNVGAAADFTKVTDPATVNDWKAFFGPNAKDTSWVGGVWSDKSVFGNVTDYKAATDEVEGNDFNLSIDDNNFLVALSAIASSKSVEGYSTLPTDTILVLDLSGSMNVDNGTDPYVTMVASANNAIDRLLALNANNRVGVIAYSGNTSSDQAAASSTATVILPLGRWNKGIDNQNRSAYLVSSWRSGNSNRNGVKVASGVTGTVAEGVKSTFRESNNKQVTGGTYTQNGIYKAQQMFGEVNHTTVQEGIQAGTKRKPVMVLMSDGCPTVASTDYTNIETSNSGNGTENTYGSNGIAFMTQLTAAWARDKIEEKYDNEPLVYTLGLNVGGKAPALSLLDPSNNTSTDSYWDTFIGLADKSDKDMNVNIRVNGTENKSITYTAPVDETRGWSEDYVTRYFGANSTTSLNEAFEDIVEQIIIQSLYYPTLVSDGNSIDHDGFLEFDDYIGKNMEVKAIKGIQLGSKLYDGSTLARMIYQGGMGTVEAPTEAGDNMVWAVKSRMGIDDTAVARELIGKAYASGQLYYHINEENGTVEYSNYIGWYADKDGKYVAFWDGEDASLDAVPENIKEKVVYANKSYGYYDAVGEGHRKTDMMYATILVRTTVNGNAQGKADATETGDTRVIGKIPASLIPLVEYDIKLNGTDPLNPSSLTINGATAPSRLLYEVGLSSKIDLLDIENTAPDKLIKDENGKYVFYTNQWDAIDGSGYEYRYSENHNTISFFEPSKENERYYYNIDTPIYTDTNGTLYKGDNAPTYNASSPLYHRSIIYKVEGNRTVAEWQYEQISEHVLTHEGDIAKKADNTWYVTAGTIHHYFGDYAMEKEENKTGTITYSDMPFVHDLEVGINHSEYHVDSFLGNNGKLTLDAYEGIKISKTSDATIADKTLDFEFNVTADVNDELTLIKEDAFGVRTESTIDFNGAYTVTIKHGETFWLLGEALSGKTVTVKENTTGKEYEVLSVNGDQNQKEAVITVNKDIISSAEFINTIPQEGDVVISKTVVSSIDGHFDDAFSFEISLEGAQAGKVYNLVFSNGTTDTITDAGKVITLKHGESVAIRELEENVVVKVKEINTPAGFTVDNAEQSVTVVAGELHYISFTNTYSASSTDEANINIDINKNLLDSNGNSADWNGTFNFKVQHFDGNGYVDIDDAKITYSKGGANSVSVDVLKNKTYDSVGDYYYRIVEVVDEENVKAGIVYDTTYARFVVRVADDGQGKLYISEVANISDTSVNGKDVTAEFNNTYEVNGAAEVIIDINKTVKNVHNQTANLLPAGYSFSLYPAVINAENKFEIAGGAIKVSPETAAAGTARISLLYDDISQVGTHHYVLKENVGNIHGVAYTEKEYYITVVVGHNNGYFNVSATMGENTVTASGSDKNLIALVEIDGADFENTFTPDEVILTPNLTAGKILVGRDIVSNDNFRFGLFEADSSFNEGALFKEATADTNGFVSFGEISYTTEGERYYVVKEIIPSEATDNKLNGVTYDTKEYHLSVSVTGDATTGKLSCTYDITLDGQPVNVMTFNNTYETEPVGVTINGTKTLSGGIRKLQARAFGFELLENGTVIDTVYNGVPTDDYNASFSFNLNYTEEGVHNYTVREKLPKNIDENGKYGGVTWDRTEYSVVVTVTDNGTGALVAEVDTNNNAIAFNNTYSVEAVSETISIKKNLLGDSIAKYVGGKAFKFELYSATLAHGEITPVSLIKTVANDEDGNVDFGEINYNTIGGYHYIIKEVVPAEKDELMIYDNSYYIVEIDVTDNLAGKLVADKKITKVLGSEKTEQTEIIFNNEIKPEKQSAVISGEKQYNKNLNDGMFSFELYQALKGADGKINAVGEAVFTVSNVGKNFEFKDIEETDDKGNIVKTEYLTYTKEGEYYYVVKEVLPEGAEDGKKDGIKYDTKEHVVTVKVTKETDGSGRDVLKVTVENEDGGLIVINEYSTSKASASIKAKKNVIGDAIGKYVDDKAFSFQLYTAKIENGEIKEDTLLKTISNDEGGNVDFGAFEYDEEGKYYYIIKEVVPAEKDELMIYDNAYYIVEVNVTDDNAGKLIAEQKIQKTANGVTTGETKIVFTNEVKPEKQSAIIVGEKKYNRTLRDGVFTFELYNAEKTADGKINAVGEAVLSTSNIGKNFEFKDIDITDDEGNVVKTEYLTYTKEGEYYYVVKEVLPEGAEDGKKDGIKYDTKEHVVIVKVTKETDSSGRDVLRVTVENEDGGLIVINEYSTVGATYTIEAKKTLKGRELRNQEFEFALYDKDGNEIDSAKNDEKGKISFKSLSFDEEGVFNYTVKEKIGEAESGLVYDTNEYSVIITVTDNNKGSLEATAEFKLGDKAQRNIEFVNTYEKPVEEETEDTPPTGDTSHIVILTIIAGVLALGIIALLIYRKKSNKA